MKVLDFLENRVANKTLSFTGTFLKALPSRIEKISFMIWFIACHWKILPIYFHLYSYFLFFLIYQCFQRNLPTDCSRSSKLIVSQTNALSHKSKGSGSPKHEAGFLLPSMEDCIRQNERQCSSCIEIHKYVSGIKNSSEITLLICCHQFFSRDKKAIYCTTDISSITVYKCPINTWSGSQH